MMHVAVVVTVHRPTDLKLALDLDGSLDSCIRAQSGMARYQRASERASEQASVAELPFVERLAVLGRKRGLTSEP